MSETVAPVATNPTTTAVVNAPSLSSKAKIIAWLTSSTTIHGFCFMLGDAAEYGQGKIDLGTFIAVGVPALLAFLAPQLSAPTGAQIGAIVADVVMQKTGRASIATVIPPTPLKGL